jgi:hypothetical protein
MSEAKLMFDNFLSALGDRFRQQYPHGSIVSDLVQIHGDQYVVKVSVSSADSILVSTLAVDTNLVQAENRAIERALNILGIREAHEPANLTVVSSPGSPMNLTTATQIEPEWEVPTTVSATMEPLNNRANSSLSATVIAQGINTTVESSIIEETPLASTLAEAPIKIVAEVLSTLAEEHIEFNDQPNSPEPDEEITTPNTNGQTANLVMPPETSTQLSEESMAKAAAIETSRAKKTPPANTAEPPLDETTAPTADPPLSVTDMIPMINMELKRLGWSKDRGRDYMVSLYNKRASALLSDDELFGLLQHLQAEVIA